jgi:hypothetical protein
MQTELPRLATTVRSHEYFCYAYPHLPDDYPFPAAWSLAKAGGPLDAVILTSTLPDHAANLILNNLAGPLTPIVSFVPDSRPWLDAAGSEHEAWERAQAIQLRLREIAESVRHSSEPEEMLMARMYSRDTALEAVHDPSHRDFVHYPAAERLAEAAETAQRLARHGYLTRQFFDRTQVCPQCRSARLSVREECPRCRSPNLHEEIMVHHFRCAHIAPESHFHADGDFVCPKCGRALRHIGLDYDKPGSVAHCDSCGAVNDRPAVGFKCMDCGAQHDSEQVPSRDWFSFHLTPLAVQHLRAGGPGPQQTAWPAPDSFRVLLEHAGRENRAFKIPYTVVRLSFTQAGTIKAENLRLWELTLNLVQDALHSALREVDIVRQDGEGAFLILMPNTDEARARQAIGFVARRLEAVLKVDPGIAFDIIDPRQIRRLYDDAA